MVHTRNSNYRKLVNQKLKIYFPIQYNPGILEKKGNIVESEFETIIDDNALIVSQAQENLMPECLWRLNLLELTSNEHESPLRNIFAQKKHIKLLDYNRKDDSDQYRHTVATVWRLSFDRIETSDPVTSSRL